MHIQIETLDLAVVNDLLEINESNPHQLLEKKMEISKGATIVLKKVKRHRAPNHLDVYEFLLQISSNVFCGLVAAWLYEKLGKRSIKLKIGGTEVPVKQENISVAIEKASEDIEDEKD